VTRTVAITIFSLLFALLCFQVLSRIVFNVPLGWITEGATYMLVASVWISAGIFTRMDAHIRIEFFYSKLGKLSPGLKRTVDGLIDLGFLFFLVVVTVSAVNLAIQNRDAISPALHIPIALLYSVIAVSALIMAYFLLEVVGTRRHKNR
jgi:TRAP-type C4-dicarboxylate transport system permease small subunit